MFSITPKNNRIGVIAAALLMAIFGLALVTKAGASQWDEKSVITFSAPVKIPGAVLPPGTYVFKLMNSSTDRHIVQIFDRDEKRVYATVFAVPDYRLEPTDHSVIQFEEGPAGSPAAIKTWFYPGEVWGQEFIFWHS